MKVSMVSVSRRAAPPHRGHATLTNSGTFSSGERPVAGDLDAVRQHHRKLILGHRHDAACRAVDHRNRRAPIALARDAPVLDAEGDGGLAEAVLLGVRGHPPARLLAGQARPPAGVFHDAVIRERLSHAGFRRQCAVHRTDHRTHGDAVFAAEFEVALVVRGHRHDRAGAVAHQDEVAHPDGDALAAVRIDGAVTGEEAFLFDVARVAIGARVHHGFGAGAALGVQERLVQRMLRRQDHAGGAVDGIHAGGEDADGLARSSARWKSTSAPSERPIQLRCMVSTRSGQPPSSCRMSSSNWSA